MRKKLALIFCLLAAASLLAGCALIQKDTSLTVLTVNGKSTHTLGEFERTLNANLDSYYQQMYEERLNDANQDQSKVTMPTRDSEEFLSYAREQVKEAFIRQDVTEQKTDELNARLTEEESQAYNDYLSRYDQMYSLFLSIYQDSLIESIQNGEMTYDQAIDQLNRQVMANVGEPPTSQQKKLALTLAEKDGVSVTDEELRSELDTHIAADTAAYTGNAASWLNAKNNGATLYYTPAGLRTVHQILVQFSDEEKTALEDLNSRIGELETAIADAETASTVEAAEAADETAEAAEVTAETTEEAAEGPKTLEQLKAELADLTAQRDAMWAGLEEKAKGVVERARAGEDWAALTEEFNTDPGMMADAETAKTGYTVCEGSGFRTAFIDGAMALAQIGDISDPIRDEYNPGNGMMYGFYIIRYTGDVEEGPVTLDAVRDVIHEHVYNEKAQEHFEEQLDQWAKDAQVDFREDLLK